ncbi:hypothetical protein LCGC14_2795040 [marine sediment metagenome]|uniref:Uncharacterized protein n=1 Tax=marine sediment metagenome TaxID=412755 RepID=A0A0F9AY16_9ZZZZ
MAEIRQYVLVDRADTEQDAEYDTYIEARDAAVRLNGDFAVICRTYTYDDSELVWTPDGSDTWPPAKGE